jgi:hypothetical protein
MRDLNAAFKALVDGARLEKPKGLTRAVLVFCRKPGPEAANDSKQR